MPVSAEHDEKKSDQDSARARRLREEAQRPMGVNLAEGIALSRMLAQFVGSATTS